MFFKKKKILSIDELNAYRLAYGKPIEKKELFLSLGVPFVVAFFYIFILFYCWWLALIAGFVAMGYGYTFIVPQQVKRVYENNAFREKNNFVNNMTQILTNNDKTVLQALKTVADRSNGEFKEDLLKLQAKIVDGTDDDVQNSFLWLAEKYESDVIFSLYVEQLTTLIVEGRSNIETLKDIKTYHNEIKKRQETFFNQKQQKERDFKFMCKVGVLFIITMTVSFGFKQFIEVYAHNPIGWVSSLTYLLLLAQTYHTFLKRMGDDSIMEVKI
ncbi:hypothetical protein D4A35_17795 (plasmid) [Paraclostridium bifermentans]|uniref:Type II secretion system protein GspF domain-containing protein n=1 Tax=Paraclostridium bifermentans TaxID=1490 RepID=A0A5P3XKB4_PARBF|nr:hypothetical protein [Paraclostridium bifermentans]QEZ70791.1 hypothetical protein D4A35_17795 [Paraclostridium bifermentans]